MKDLPLVSIITPCYNGEKYIHRLLDSVLSQTYNNIELIIVDDGSTDQTQSIINQYKDKFLLSGIILKNIYQTNLGQAAAINKGLSVMTGDYLTWIDSDDFLKRNSIEIRLDCLKKNCEGCFCITQYEFVNENNINKVKYIGKRVKPIGEDTFFYDLLLCRNVVFAGSVMISTKNFIKAIPENKIYESREGQNWQLMLPITYNYKCVYIDKPLYVVVQHNDSHSRSKRTLYQKIERCINFIDLINQTIKKMNLPKEIEDYINQIVDKKQIGDIIYIGIQENRNDIIKKYYSIYKKKYGEQETIILKKEINRKRRFIFISKLKSNNIIRKLFHKSIL